MYGIDWEVVGSYKGGDMDGHEKNGIAPPDFGSSRGLGVTSMMVVDKIERETEEPGDHLWL